MEEVPHSSVMTPGCGGLPASILALLSRQCPSAAGAPPRRRRRAGSTAGLGEGSACRGRRAALASGELAGGARLWSFWAALSAKAWRAKGNGASAFSCCCSPPWPSSTLGVRSRGAARLSGKFSSCVSSALSGASRSSRGQVRGERGAPREGAAEAAAAASCESLFSRRTGGEDRGSGGGVSAEWHGRIGTAAAGRCARILHVI